jgi:hypothetical protein
MSRLLLLLALLCAPLGATVAAKLDLDALTDGATIIVRGKIDSVQARWNADNTGIFTHHTVSVSTTLKGEHKATIEFVTAGGIVGRKGQAVAGSGNFAKGEEHVFFLWRDSEKRLQLVGMVQGALKIVEENGVTRARNSFAGLTLVDAKTLKPLADADKAPIDLAFSDLESKVKARVKAAEQAANKVAGSGEKK